jgi:predicted nucleotidyltransferase
MRTVPLDQVVAPDAAARLLAFRAEVMRALPGAVRDVVLFGSRARGDARPDSDYDVAVLLEGNLADEREVRYYLSDTALEYGLLGFDVSPIALSAEDICAAVPPTELATRIALEGVPVR